MPTRSPCQTIFAGFRRALLASAALAMLGAGAQAAELPLTRVVLSSAGLGQFSFEGAVAAGSAIDLQVRRDQVDDVLKSLTVFDALGALGPVSLPGKEPLEELFRDLPFDHAALSSPTTLLNALVGAEVEIAGPVAARGRIFRVEPEEVALPDGRGITTRHRLSLVTEAGMVQAVLEEVTALAFTAPEARKQIDRALSGLTENRAKDRRRLSIEVLGQGERKVAVSYVVGAPIWKTSWRLVLPKGEGKARLQGWAILENLTGGDWKDVELTLVSGNPVALTQPLYTAVFGHRTEVPIPGGAAVAPRADGAPPPALAMARSGAHNKAQLEDAAELSIGRPMLAPSPPPMAGAAPGHAAEAEEAATQLIYRFPAKVSLPTGHTLMVPFVDREVAVERVWLYQPDTDRSRPLAALRLKNDGDIALPPGIVTAFDTAASGTIQHVGDAMLPLVPREAAKFISLALDTKTEIRREDRGVRRTTLGTLANGRLTTTIRSRQRIAYEITPPPDEDRTIIIEERRNAGWAPAADIKNVEATPTLYRWRLAVPKGQTTKAELVTERTDRQTVTLTELSAEDMLVQIQGLDNEGPAFKEAVNRLADIVADIAKAEGQREQNEAERGKITRDQERIRANLQAVAANSDLGRRYMDTLRSQENRLTELAKSDQTLTDAIAQKRKAAAELAKTLTL
jgi:hypothetical protein